MDGIVSLPFTGHTILETLITGVKHKLNPSPYVKKIEEGRGSYLKGNLELANTAFQAALKLHKHPYEGHYFLGRINYDNNLEEEAIKCYEEAVSHNSAFYKGLKALCSIYYQKKDFAKAYDTNLLMANSFPTSPARIPELIRLSIINQKYEDVSNYLQVSKSIETPSSEIQIYLSAGLAILGKYFSTTNDLEKGTEALITAFDFSNGKYEILKSITESFQKFNKLNVLLEKFEQIDISNWSNESQGLYFHTLHLTSEDDNQVINLGEKLMRNKVRTIHVYKGLIERGIKIKRKSNFFEYVVLEGLANVPDSKEELERMLASAIIEIQKV